MYQCFKIKEAVANQSGAMEADTISKNGRSSKSQKSRESIMKRIFLFFVVFCVSVASTFAQDVIRLKNGIEIEALVQETGEDDIKFKKYDNPDCRDYTLKKSEINMIIYANSGKEEFIDVELTTMRRTSRLVTKSSGAYMKQMFQDFENRMNICGFKNRIIVYDLLDNNTRVQQERLNDFGWCTVGIWFNYDKRLVALRLDKDSWNEIIIPFGKILKISDVNIEGLSKTTIAPNLFGNYVATTREKIKGVQMRIVTGDINTGTQPYTLVLYDRYPNSPLDPSYSVSHYHKIKKCVQSIIDEFELIMKH